MKTLRILSLAALASCLLAASIQASALTRPQILKELQNLEVCLRTMCIPAHDGSMSISGTKTLLAKLNQNPTALDRWTIQRLNAEALLLQQKKLAEALTALQSTIKELPAQ